MSASKKHAQLIEKIIIATDNGGMDWKPTQVSDRFRLSFSSGMIEIFQETIDDPSDEMSETYDVIFEMYDNNENLVDRFSDVDLSRSGYRPFGENPGWYRKLLSFYQDVRRVALGVDDILNSFISEVNSKIPRS